MRDENWIINKINLVFKIFAWVAAALGVLFFVVILVGGGSPEAPRGVSVLALVLGFFYFVFFYAVAEVLRLIVRIEKNTRRE
jgi:hypothetical protein